MRQEKHTKTDGFWMIKQVVWVLRVVEGLLHF